MSIPRVPDQAAAEPADGAEAARPLLRWSVRVLFLVALLAAAGISWIQWTGDAQALPGCAALPRFDCQAALDARWSRWLGVPVGAFGAGLYAAMLVAAWFVGPRWPPGARRAAWAILVPAAAASAGAALWFAGLMVFRAYSGETLCSWCLLAQGAGLLGSVLVLGWVFRGDMPRGEAGRLRGLAALVEAPRGGGPATRSKAVLSRPIAGALTALGILGVAALVVGQVAAPPRGPAVTAAARKPGAPRGGPAAGSAEGTAGTAGQPDRPTGSPQPAVEREVEMLAGKVTLNTASFPVLGDARAKWIIVSLTDYTDADCRILDRQLGEARQRYGDQMAVMVLPVPMNTDCNPFVGETGPEQREACELARLAMAVWQADAAKFAAFHRWLYESDRPPTYLAAIERATQLVGQDPLERALVDSAIDEMIQRATQVYSKAGPEPVPILLVDDFVIVGKGSLKQKLFGVLEQRLGMAPTGS